MKIAKPFIALLLLASLAPAASAQNDGRAGRNNRQRSHENSSSALTEQRTRKQPCMRYDDEEYYTASGFFRIKVAGVGERDYTLEFNKQLNSLRQQVKVKLGGKYRAVLYDYFDQLDIERGSSTAQHLVSVGEQAIDRFLNDTEEDCREFGEVDEAGYQMVYMGILISKAEVANVLIQVMEEDHSVPADIQQQVRINEAKFRQQAMKVFNQ